MNLGKDLGWQAGLSIVGVAVLLVLGVIAMESYTLLIQRVPESALRGPHVLFDAAVLLRCRRNRTSAAAGAGDPPLRASSMLCWAKASPSITN